MSQNVRGNAIATAIMVSNPESVSVWLTFAKKVEAVLVGTVNNGVTGLFFGFAGHDLLTL
jgi:hypothetical protein